MNNDLEKSIKEACALNIKEKDIPKNRFCRQCQSIRKRGE